MSKLTLSVDPVVVSRAKKYAEQHGTSVSELVETYLAALSAPTPERELPPVLKSLRGILKKGDVQDHKRHLVEKYR